MVILARAVGSARLAAVVALAGFALSAAACGGTLDAGHDEPQGPLPVDARNPVIIDNDGWSDNWMGEYAALLANNGGPALAGIIVNKTAYWTEGADNTSGWKRMVAAARTSGLKNIPEITVSTGGPPLQRPADGNIDTTVPNDAPGARRIVELSRQFSLPRRPLVVVCGSGLTNVADAYLIDHGVKDRVVVVAALGTNTMSVGRMAGPNGELDVWADWIVTQRFTYVQVSTYYNQRNDVTEEQFANLPPKPLGAWMAEKASGIFGAPTAADQVAVLAVGVPGFVVAVQRSSPDTSAAFDPALGPPFKPDTNGNAYIVTQIAAPLASSRLWLMLLNPLTFDQ